MSEWVNGCMWCVFKCVCVRACVCVHVRVLCVRVCVYTCVYTFTRRKHNSLVQSIVMCKRIHQTLDYSLPTLIHVHTHTHTVYAVLAVTAVGQTVMYHCA